LHKLLTLYTFLESLFKSILLTKSLGNCEHFSTKGHLLLFPLFFSFCFSFHSFHTCTISHSILNYSKAFSCCGTSSIAASNICFLQSWQLWQHQGSEESNSSEHRYSWDIL